MPIDLRSDTVTQPSDAMREVMAQAPVGDDIYGEDPSIIELQNKAAELTGKEAALFVPSGTMANQLSLGSLTRPGDEVIIGQGSHCYLYEGGAGAALNGLQFQFVGTGGLFTARDVHDAYKPDTHHYAPTTVVAVENTHNQGGGKVWDLNAMREVCAAARERGMGLHLDGARIFNAQVHSGVSVREWSEPFDTVAFCLSKGLGAPVGSLVCSSAARIERAHRLRKMFGGAMRQAGILAAGGLYALEHNVGRLAQDHETARLFARELAGAPNVQIDADAVETNIVWFTLEESGPDSATLVKAAAERDVLLNALGERSVRAVTHLDVSADEVKSAAQVLREILAGWEGGGPR